MRGLGAAAERTADRVMSGSGTAKVVAHLGHFTFLPTGRSVLVFKTALHDGHAKEAGMAHRSQEEGIRTLAPPSPIVPAQLRDRKSKKTRSLRGLFYDEPE